MAQKSSIILSFIMFFVFAQSTVFSQVNSSLKVKLNQVLDAVNSSYVDTVNMEKLINTTIATMLKELDPHSTFIDKKDVEKMNQPLEGSFDGIGIEYSIVEDTLFIIATIPKTSANREGMKSGDKIISIDGVNVAYKGITVEEIKKRLTGSRGTEVTVTVKRRNSKKLIDFVLTRDKVPIRSVDASYLVENDIAYIKINRFAATTLEEFITAYTKLAMQGAKSIIVDLRDNGGGYLNTATDLADEFLDGEKMIVYTEGINNLRSEYKSTGAGSFETGKLVVMIDEGSASASEIFAGAIQDWDRGIVVGRRSFGKGLVQRAFNLIDGSMFRLTIARYYTPTGRLIQKSYKKGTKEYNMDIANRMAHGEMLNADSIHFNDSMRYTTMLTKRVVYGGGGIMPDVFVPMDTLKVPPFYQSWVQASIVGNFVLRYIEKNQKMLDKKYPDFEKFNSDFVVNDDILKQLEKYAQRIESAKANTKTTDKDGEKKYDYGLAKDNIKLQIKALIARDLWTTSEYFHVLNQNNPSFKKAVEVIQNEDIYVSKLNP